MSLKFACQKCYQTLVTTEHKVGQSVRCPRCAASIVIPDPQTAAALLEKKRLAREKAVPRTASAVTSRPTNGASHAAPAEPVAPAAKPQREAAALPARSVKSSPPSLPPTAKTKPREAPRASPASEKPAEKTAEKRVEIRPEARVEKRVEKRAARPQDNAAAASSPVAASSSVAQSSAATLTDRAAKAPEQAIAAPARGVAPSPRAQPAVDPRRVSVGRWVLFAQAGLIAVVATVAYLSGYIIGGGPASNGARNQSGELVPDTFSAVAPVQITGAVRYDGDKKADGDAVIIILPKGAAPAEKISIAGLRRADPPPVDNNAQVRIIESLDGAYARADSAGKFRVSVRPGEYLVLAISRHANRPNGQNPSAENLALVEQFFAPAGELLGQSKYDLSERTLSDAKPLEFDF